MQESSAECIAVRKQAVPLLPPAPTVRHCLAPFSGCALPSSLAGTSFIHNCPPFVSIAASADAVVADITRFMAAQPQDPAAPPVPRYAWQVHEDPR